MAQPLLTACGLNDQRLPAFTLVKQHSGVDGSFLIASVLGQRLKLSRENRVLLVAAQHNYNHYSSACLKLAYNLAPSRDSGQLEVLDVGAELYQNYPASCPRLDDVVKRIRTFLEGSPRGTVLFDDLMYFLNFDDSETQLIDIMEDLAGNLSEDQALVVKLNTADLYEVLCANLDDLAQTTIQLERLPSGTFREVDGKMSVSRWQPSEAESLISVKQLERSVLFKVCERNVRIFVPGELGIKHL
ncbi:elongator complex protein 6 [Toxorhynchites rutilus septentrionalis]|uniref:elongator complex protein 6 n=1 Tax=Toxorhynchites rutilus septentrionalis TaxID=329112 RepID=UPI00247905D5|nr:elongator complex protein 6 [Toxorhynchites rutilus septentrionalis]XP_055641137.1 elongator complex protein 6 [Toxorhynchites rutilus septentrionalis]